SFDYAMNYAKEHKDTLVVATADHSTGGLSIAKGEDYLWNPQVIHDMKHSGTYMTEQIAKGEDAEQVINEGYGFDVEAAQIDKIKDEAEKLKKLNEDDEAYEGQLQELQNAIQKPINDKSNTGWTTTGHTGEDVNTYAFGPGSDKFQGNIDNTDNAKNIFELLKSDAK
ncbi:MAG: alkaline phosphatase, partial [Staphylococcus equorum]|nr:alkaline phosphatase [Staphylococcus equorum]